MSTTPKYEHIMHRLIEQITNQQILPGEEIPSETELMDQFHVSRITVRRALDELSRNGYIEKSQGKRAYVKDLAKLQELSTISSYTEEILRHGMVPSRKVIHSELRLGTSEEQNELNLDKASAVYHLERVISADNAPLCYSMTTLPYEIFRDIENYDFGSSSLYSVIENDYHIKISTSQLKLKAISAPAEIAGYLHITPGSPLLYTNAVTYGIYNGTEIPIETFKTFYLTEHFEYSLIQSR